MILNYSLFYKIIFAATDTTDTTATATAKKAKKATADIRTSVAADNNKSTAITDNFPKDGELLLLFYYFMFCCSSFCFLFTSFILLFYFVSFLSERKL